MRLCILAIMGLGILIGTGCTKEEPEDGTQTPTERQVVPDNVPEPDEEDAGEPIDGDEGDAVEPTEDDSAEPVDLAPAQMEVAQMGRLQGTWVGGVAGYDEAVKLTFADGSAEFSADLGGIQYKGSVEINEDASPKQADYTITECNIEQYVGKTALGIYQFEGDTLVLAANEPGRAQRPTEFQPMGGTQVFEFKPAKPF